MDSEDEEEMAAAAAAGTLPPGLGPAPGGALPGLGAAAPALPPVTVPGVPVAGAAPPLPPVGDAPPAEGGDDDGGGGGDALLGQFLVKETGASCKALFVPNGTRLTMKKLMDLKEAWEEMGDVGTLVSCDAGTVHPGLFATIGLAKLASFEQFWADAKQHAERAHQIDANIAKPGQEAEDFALGVINNVLWVKLCTIFSAILDAAAVANNWIVIDRVKAKSPSADLLIEAAMGQTSARPIILVVDSISRLKKFRGETGSGPICDVSQACIDKFNKIKGPGTIFGTDDRPPSVTINQLYAVADFADPQSFMGQPLPRPPEKPHVTPALIPDPPHINARFVWQYHYLATFFASGSHYIVLEHENDGPDLTCMGSFGFVAANGQGLMFPRLKTRIQAGESLVMLHNTGGVVQAFCSLRDGILSEFPVPEANKLLDKLELVSPQPWCNAFGLPEILMMKELHQRAPMLLRTSVVAVDTMRDSSEDVLNTLTCCFAGGGGVPELGLGEAESLCIITAWKRHMTLIENAYKYEIYADLLYWLMTFLAIITTTIALIYGLPVPEVVAANSAGVAEALGLEIVGGNSGSGDAGSGSGDAGSGSGDAASGDAASGDPLQPTLPPGVTPIDPNTATPLDLIMVFLPLALTFLGTLRTKVRPREKWGTCLMAAHQIVSQIYFYRLRTNQYSIAAAVAAALAADPDAEPPNPKMLEVNFRKLFVDTCSSIYSYAISTEISKGGALKMGRMAKYQTQYSDERNKFTLELRIHVEKKLHGLNDMKKAKKTAGDTPTGDGGGDKKKGKGLFKKKNKIVAILDDGMAEAQAMAEGIQNVGDALGQAAGMDNGDGPAPDLAPVKMEVGDDLGAKAGSAHDDLTSQMPIESYVGVRVREIVAFLEDKAPLMARRSFIIEMISMLSNSAGAILGVLKYGTWAPVTVAIASAAMAIADYFYLPSQLAATNRALEETHNLLIYWDSLSLVQRKTPKVKLTVSETVENAVLALIAAQTGVSPALPNEQAGEEEEES